MFRTTSDILRDRGLTGPTVVLDEARARANIARMAGRARDAGAVFRPHFKTHQSPAVAGWFRDAGVDRITVSSLDMALRFAAAGWHDITVGILHNPRETARADALARDLAARGGRLGLVVDDAGVAAALARDLTCPVAIWLKIDTGYGRTGLPWDDRPALGAVRDACRGLATAVGLLTHAGHSYRARGREAMQRICDETVTRLRAARDACGGDDLLLSLGDTPCCSLAADLSACDEIRPGNFVFFDLMQLEIGSCGPDDLAAAVACPVLGVYPARREIVLHGGAVHLSKEALAGPGGQAFYGCLGTLDDTGFESLVWTFPLVSLSQEHGTVACLDGVPLDLSPGDMVLVWPVHSCLCCDLLRDQLVEPVTFGA